MASEVAIVGWVILDLYEVQLRRTHGRGGMS